MTTTVALPQGFVPRRILVVRRDNIGDLVCTTPLFAALRQAFPDAHLAALVNSYNGPVLTGNPALDAVHPYLKLKHREAGTTRRRALLDRLKLIATLRRSRFDLAILARAGFDRHGLNFLRWLGIPHVIGYGPGDAPWGLTMPLVPPDNETLHEVEAVQGLLRPLGIPAVPGPLQLYPDPIRREALRHRFGGGLPLVAVHISAREPDRRLSPEKWRAVLEGLDAALPGYRPVLFWSPGAGDDPRHPGDDALAARLLAETVGLGVVPAPTAALPELMDGLAACNLFIGADGGAMHVAAGVGLPTVALFENSPYKLRHWHPWKIPHRIVASPTFPVGDINPTAILAAASELSLQAR